MNGFLFLIIMFILGMLIAGGIGFGMISLAKRFTTNRPSKFDQFMVDNDKDGEENDTNL